MKAKLQIFFLTKYLAWRGCSLVRALNDPRCFAVFGNGKHANEPRVKRAIEKLRGLLEKEASQ
jgi:hypothetical protein